MRIAGSYINKRLRVAGQVSHRQYLTQAQREEWVALQADMTAPDRVDCPECGSETVAGRCVAQCGRNAA